MYKSFFRLTRNPFGISPDPYFLYTTAQHQEALAGLYYGITARKGFLVLTGEVGTGKTLVIHCLRALLDKNRVAYAYVFNTRLSSLQFLQYMAEDLGVYHHLLSKGELLIRLSQHLIERHRQGLTTALLVDEAQHLSTAVLEEIRLLTNLETPQGKLLQIALVGQPELNAKLVSSALRQIRQRITMWFQLRLLSEPETHGYVRYRLKLAGDEEGQIFALPTLERVHFFSNGTPRLINTLCDNAMVSAFALGQGQVTPELIDEAASDLGLRRVNGDGQGTASEIPSHPEGETERKGKSLAPVIQSFFREQFPDTSVDSSSREGSD